MSELLKTGPSINKGRSCQDYRTPQELLIAVLARFQLARFDWDLAASDANTVAPNWITEQQDALLTNWKGMAGNLWCNPPHGNCAPWAKLAKLSGSNNRRIFLLVPAAVGSNWFADHIDRQALVLFLRPRLSFDGKNSYPRDLTLCVYGLGPVGYECWRWK